MNVFHSSNPVVRRCGDKGKATNHCSANHEIHFAHRCSRSLPFQNLEEVTMVGRLWLAGVTFLQRLSHFRPDRPVPAAIFILPGQTVVLAGRANNLLRVLIYF